MWGAKILPSEIKKKAKMPPIASFVHYCMSQTEQLTKRMNNIHIATWEIMTNCLDLLENIILFVETKKNSTNKILELINSFNDIVRYKINNKIDN